MIYEYEYSKGLRIVCMSKPHFLCSIQPKSPLHLLEGLHSGFTFINPLYLYTVLLTYYCYHAIPGLIPSFIKSCTRFSLAALLQYYPLESFLAKTANGQRFSSGREGLRESRFFLVEWKRNKQCSVSGENVRFSFSYREWKL